MFARFAFGPPSIRIPGYACAQILSMTNQSNILVSYYVFKTLILIYVKKNFCQKFNEIKNLKQKLECGIASDIWGLRDIIQLLLNFIKF